MGLHHDWRATGLPSLALLGAAACVPPVPTQEVGAPAAKPVFAFTAPEPCRTPGSAKVTFAIVAPHWDTPASEASTTQFSQYDSQRRAMYDQFSTAMKNDFLSLVSCKGFAAKGPYRNDDEITYPDRLGTDLTLAPEVSLSVLIEASTADPPVTVGDFLAAVISKEASAGQIVVNGTATISGRVTIALKESLTSTRMWTRSIELAQETFSFKGETKYPAAYASFVSQLALADPAFLRAFGPKLQTIYKRVLATSWNYMDAQEMAVVKQQSLGPRSKAVTIQRP